MGNENIIEEADTLPGASHPRLAKKLVGHEIAFDTFVKSYRRGTLHHAWLLTGPKGIGKATLAWKLSEELINERGLVPPDPKIEENLKGQFKALPLQNLYLCRRPYDDKTKRLKKYITVDEIRKLKGFFNLSAIEKTWRIALIDCADELNKSATNALLKLLEEPPIKSVFIIIANQPEKLSSTVRSRCRQLSLRKLSRTDVEKVLLLSGYDLEKTPEFDRNIINILSNGSPGNAIMAIENDGVSVFLSSLDILSDFPRFKREKIVALAETVKSNVLRFNFVSSILLLILSRLALITHSINYVEATEQETNLISKILKSRNLPVILSTTYKELSRSFAECEELNLDAVNQITNAFLLIEKRLSDR